MAKPTDKSLSIDKFLSAIMGKNRRETILSNTCMGCSGSALKFRDEKSRREYSISGLCQYCQDDFFGK